MLTGQAELLGQRAERHRKPVRAAAARRPDLDILARHDLLEGIRLNRPPRLHVDALGPGHLDVGIGGNELPGRALDDIEDAAAIGLDDHLLGRTVDRDVGQHQRVDAVIVERVVRRGLIVPGPFAGLGMEGDHRVGEQIVARPYQRISTAPDCRCPRTRDRARDRRSRSARRRCRRRSSRGRYWPARSPSLSRPAPESCSASTCSLPVAASKPIR